MSINMLPNNINSLLLTEDGNSSKIISIFFPLWLGALEGTLIPDLTIQPLETQDTMNY